MDYTFTHLKTYGEIKKDWERAAEYTNRLFFDPPNYQFRKGKIDLLIATDVASRGLDIQGITHIINYDVPMEALVYFHRIGRTARMGQDGTAITLVGYGEISEFNNIKALTKTTIEEITDLPLIPTPF